MTTLLEQRRLEARAFDETQRQAERAAQVRLTEKPRAVPPASAPQEPKSSDQVLAELLIRGGLVTVSDLAVVVEHFERQLDELRASLPDDDQSA